MTMKPDNKYLHLLMLLCIPLMLTLMLLLPTPGISEEFDFENETYDGVIILEDPALLGDMEEDAHGSARAASATPTDLPAATPDPAPEYLIELKLPEGWYASRAAMEINVHDIGGTGWTNVKVVMETASMTTTLVNGALPSGHLWVDLLDNCTITVTVTDPKGKPHEEEADVTCFDKQIPRLTASVQGESLVIEASDALSGLYGVQVIGNLYTELTGGKLNIALKGYADAYEQLLVQSIDNVGNVSPAIAVANPFYKRPDTPTSVPTTAPTTAPTAAPTKKPPTSGGSSGGNGTSSGAKPTATPEVTAAPTSMPTAVPAVVPTAAPIIYTLQDGTPFSSMGNAYTRDLLYDRATNKQFIAIETKDGTIYYMVIDYDKPLDDTGERYETYFLNLVDNRDLLDVVDEADYPTEPEVIYVTVTPEPTPVVQQPETPHQGAQDNSAAMLALIGLLLAGGGFALWYFKFRKPAQGKHARAMEDYDDEESEAEDETENEDE